jgi:hypothetical protein
MKKEGMLLDTDLLWVCEKIMVVTHKFHCSNECKGEIRPQGSSEKKENPVRVANKPRNMVRHALTTPEI